MKDCLRLSGLVLPTIAPRLIMSLRNATPAHPVGIYSDARGAGKLASISFFSLEYGRRPVLMVARVDQKMQDSVATSNKIYIYELFAATAIAFQLIDRLWGWEVILCVDNEAACAVINGRRG